jgi:hypothetical protein
LVWVDVESSALGATAGAAALTRIRFVPEADGIASLHLSSSVGGGLAYTWGYAGLYELTQSHQVWSRGWAPGGASGFSDSTFDLAFAYPQSELLLNLDMDAYLASARIYELTLYGRSSASSDTQAFRLEVLGIGIVPEPSPLALAFFGLLLVFGPGRRRRSVAHVSR